jgi:hypothetical protein
LGVASKRSRVQSCGDGLNVPAKVSHPACFYSTATGAGKIEGAREMKRMASCSDVQQVAEQLMISEFSRQLGRDLSKATIPIGKAKVQVDGFHKDDDRVTVVEAWAHIGRAKSAQRNKVLADMLKLGLLGSALRRSCPNLKVECYLVFADHAAANVALGNGWASLAAQEFRIKAQVVALSDDVIGSIKQAQQKQDLRMSDERDE